MKLYKVAHWNDNFETHDTRKLKTLLWVAIPTKMDGDGYTTLLDHPDGAAHFGAWTAMVKLAATCRPRGKFSRGNGKPLEPAGIARMTRIPVKIIKAAIPRLLEIGWLEVEDVEGQEVTGNLPTHRENLPTHRENLPTHRENPVDEGMEGMEGMEGRNGRKESPPTPPSGGTPPISQKPMMQETTPDPAGKDAVVMKSAPVCVIPPEQAEKNIRDVKSLVRPIVSKRRIWTHPPDASVVSKTVYDKLNGLVPQDIRQRVAKAVAGIRGRALASAMQMLDSFLHEKLCALVLDAERKREPRAWLTRSLIDGYSPSDGAYEKVKAWRAAEM